MRTTPVCAAVLAAIFLVTPTRAAVADEMDPPSTDDLALPPGEEPTPAEPEDHGPAPERHWHVGGGLVPYIWIPANNPLSWRFELEGRWTPGEVWSVLLDLSYIQVGESGTRSDESGFGAFAGGMREWSIGERETARLFPHVRAGLAFEATSTRTDVSAKHIAFRFGPGIDWNIAGSARVNLGLEIGFGLLSLKSGSEGDQALAELTLGLALRLLFGF